MRLLVFVERSIRVEVLSVYTGTEQGSMGVCRQETLGGTDMSPITRQHPALVSRSWLVGKWVRVGMAISHVCLEGCGVAGLVVADALHGCGCGWVDGAM